MCIFLARYRVLHYHLFVNGYVEENSPVSTDHLLLSRVDPIVHVMAQISWAIKWGIDHSSKNFSILFVLEPCSYIDRKRCWVEQHAQPCGGWSRWSCYSDCRWRCMTHCMQNCSCNCCRNIGCGWSCRSRSRCRRSNGRSRSCRGCWSGKTSCRIGNYQYPIVGSLILVKSAKLECQL